MSLALALVEATASALKKGVKHYDAAGKLLTTPLAIITCLAEEGAITIVDPGCGDRS